MFATFSFKKQSLANPPRNYLPRTREKKLLELSVYVVVSAALSPRFHCSNILRNGETFTLLSNIQPDHILSQSTMKQKFKLYVSYQICNAQTFKG